MTNRCGFFMIKEMKFAGNGSRLHIFPALPAVTGKLANTYDSCTEFTITTLKHTLFRIIKLNAAYIVSSLFN